ncbi:MAG: hypothetical protein EPO22_01810 [Dehalococcoidia bacterium]|nr:MAG: hypothetical protein EPO22_01810 [Dehalococcoidia bacterium]
MDAYPGLAITLLSFVDQEDVLRFSCGDEPWSALIDRYFHEDAFEQQLGGAATTYVVRDRATSAVKALGTLALGSVSWPKPSSGSKSVAVIFAYFGLSRALRGTTTDGVKTSFACTDTVLTEAIDLWPDADLICLSVDDENTTAIGFWSTYGFVEWGKRREEEGRTYVRMVAEAKKVLAIIEARRAAA